MSCYPRQRSADREAPRATGTERLQAPVWGRRKPLASSEAGQGLGFLDRAWTYNPAI